MIPTGNGTRIRRPTNRHSLGRSCTPARCLGVLHNDVSSRSFSMRKLICGVCALLLCVGVIIADEIKGKVKSIDESKVTVTVGDKDQSYDITADTKIVRGDKDVKDRKKAIDGVSK